MAAGAVELATGYISLVPSMQGAEKGIADILIPAARDAGDKAGDESGKKFGGGFHKAIVGLGIGAAVVGAFKGLYEIGATFDDLTDTIRIGTGAQGDALDGLVNVAKNVGKTVPAEFDKIGPVVADLNTRLGLSGDTLQTVASQYLEAGRMLGQDVDIHATTAAFSAFRVEGEDVIGAMDHLFRVSQATGIGINELASTSATAAPLVQNLGFSFEETTALVGSLDKAGLGANKMLAALGPGLVNLAKDGEEPAEAFRRVVGELEGLIASGDTAGAIDLAAGIFGTRGAAQFVGAVQSGTLALDDLVAGVGATSDTILGVGEETQDFAEKWQIVKNQAQAALEPLGSAVFSALGDALSGLLPHLEGLGAWLGENQWVLGVVAGVIGGALVAAFIAWTASIWASTIALLANPITWIVLGIVALIAALVLLIANWDSVVAWLKDVWSGIVEWLSGVWDAIVEGISTAWEGIKDFFAGVLEWIVDAFMNWTLIGLLIQHWDTIKSTVVNVWNSIVDFIKAIPQRIWDGLVGIGTWVYTNVSNAVANIKAGIQEKFTQAVDWVKGIPQKILDALGNVGQILVNAGRQIIEGLWNGLKEKWEGVKNWFSGLGDWISEHKGPKAYDLRILRPAGNWIMEGLQHGLDDQIPNLRATLGRVSDEIAATSKVSVGPAASYAALPAAPSADEAAGLMNVEVNVDLSKLRSVADIDSFLSNLRVLARQKAGVR
ncbi:MAG: phage tail tape measure protein [Nocardioides sp.]